MDLVWPAVTHKAKLRRPLARLWPRRMNENDN